MYVLVYFRGFFYSKFDFVFIIGIFMLFFFVIVFSYKVLQGNWKCKFF